MSLIKSISLMGLANVARLVGALATFSITARVLGLDRYGQLMYWMSVASILALVSNFGLVVFLLKEIGERPEKAADILSDSLAAKLIVVVVIVIGSLASLPFLGAETRWVFVFLLGSMIAEGFTEFFNSGFRARSKFGVETKIAVFTAWAYPLSVGVAAASVGSVIAISAAYFLSRAAVTWLTWFRLCKLVGPVRPSSAHVGWSRLGSALSYACDAGLSGVFGQLDSLVLNHYLGHAAVGVHQAGMRLFLAGSGFANVLANVFIPRVSAAHAAPSGTFSAENQRLQFTFLMFGACFGLVLAVGGQWFAPILFGKSFEPVVPLMPWFGLLFMLKFAGAAWSINLTAQGKQWYRAKIGALQWVIVLGTAAVLVPRLGNVGWLISLISGSAVLFVFYAMEGFKRTSNDFRALGLAAVLFCLFVPMLRIR